MGKVIKITESQLKRIIENTINKDSDHSLNSKWNDVTSRRLLNYGAEEKEEKISPEIKRAVLEYTPQPGNWRVEKSPHSDIYELRLSFEDDSPLYEVVIYFRFLRNGKPSSTGVVLGYTSENENFMFEDDDRMIGTYLINKFDDEDYDSMGSELGR